MVSFWKLKITKEGTKLALLMAARLCFLIIGSSIMTLTTTPNQLTDALEKLLGPLKKIHVPVHEIAMMMSIALRFIPILLEETDKIMKAQIAREPILKAVTLSPGRKTWYRCWCHCLFPHSVVPTILQWRWKHAVTAVARAEQR